MTRARRSGSSCEMANSRYVKRRGGKLAREIAKIEADQRSRLKPVRMVRTRSRVTEFWEATPERTSIVVRQGREGTTGTRRRIECYAGVCVPDVFSRLLAKQKAAGFERQRSPRRAVSPAPPRAPSKPARGVALVERCIESLRPRKRLAVPYPPPALKVARLGRSPLPATLAKFLAFDHSFSSTGLRDADGSKTKRGWTPEPADIDRAVLAWLVATQGLSRKNSRVAFKKNFEGSVRKFVRRFPRGAYYSLPRAGDQLHFLFVGRASPAGEFPIVGVDFEGVVEDDGNVDGEVAVFLKYPSFDLFLADQLNQLGPEAPTLDDIPGFAKEMNAALRANARLRV